MFKFVQDRSSDDEGMWKDKKVVGLVEKIRITGKNGTKEVDALFDTGATRTSIDRKLANELGLEKTSKKVRIKTKTHPDEKVVRDIYRASLEVKGKKFEVEANVADRSNMACPVLIGRDVIHGNFVVDVSLTHRSGRIKDVR